MTTKITYISENPAFTSFEAWVENKLNSVSQKKPPLLDKYLQPNRQQIQMLIQTH